jgi:hypothetical protein
MGSGAVICIASFLKIGLDIQKLIEVDTQAHRQYDVHISLFFFQNNESVL